MSEKHGSGTFDYVVIGGGTAGLVVAARLSEDVNSSVAILEAGEDYSAESRVLTPGLASTLRGSDLDWSFETVPQSELDGRKIAIAQGKLLGGSSGINNQALIAPSAGDIDSWAALGNHQWDWATLSPYYRKFSTFSRPPDDVCIHLGVGHLSAQETGEGPIKVSYPNGALKDQLAKDWIDLFDAQGLRLKEDPFCGTSPGAYAVPSTVHPTTKQRSFAANTYHNKAKARPNYRLFTGAEVQKILFSGGDDKRAERVLFKCNGQLHELGVRREVILSAGTLQSPKILELSGIGCITLLSKHGIDPIIQNANVGENLQDHLMLGVGFEAAPGVQTLDSLARKDPEAIQTAMAQYQRDGVGPLASGSIAAHAFVPLDAVLASAGQEAAEFRRRLASTLSEGSTSPVLAEVSKLMQSPKESAIAFFPIPVQSISGELCPGNFVTIGAIQSRVFSRGYCHISSSNAADAPLVDPRYLSSDMDLELMALAVWFILNMANLPPLSSHLNDGGTRLQSTRPVDHSGAKQYVRRCAKTTWHPCGTCAMLPLDKGGVVDQNLRVYGTHNLRVVDASIFPLIPRGNIQSTVYAVAERASDIIKTIYS